MRGRWGGGHSAEVHHPGDNPWANLKSISHSCYPILLAFVWELRSICPWVACRLADEAQVILVQAIAASGGGRQALSAAFVDKVQVPLTVNPEP